MWTRPWPTRASGKGWISRRSGISTCSPPAGCFPTSRWCWTSSPPSAWRASAAGRTTRSRRWTSPSIAASARAISRSRGRRSAGRSCSTRTRTRMRFSPPSRLPWPIGSCAGRVSMPGDDAFAAIRGQDEVVALLRRALAADRVAHAYAFVGPPGAGRKLTALAFAKALVAPAGGAPAARLEAGDDVGRDRQAAETLVEACWLRYRDLLCAQAGADARLAVFAEAGERAPDHPSLHELLARLTACREAWHALQGNVSPRLTVEVLLSRLALRAA